MPTHRNFRWLLVSLAAIGFTLDLGSKYLVFRWLYHHGLPARQGSFEAWTQTTTWNGGHEIQLRGGRINLVPGWFGFTAEYNPAQKPLEQEPWRTLQTWSTKGASEGMPRVNHGALFGLGGDHEDRRQRHLRRRQPHRGPRHPRSGACGSRTPSTAGSASASASSSAAPSATSSTASSSAASATSSTSTKSNGPSSTSPTAASSSAPACC